MNQNKPAVDKPATTGSTLAAVRGFGVVLGPAILLDLFVAASTVVLATGRLWKLRGGVGRWLRPLFLAGAAFPPLYAFVVRPRHLHWGATPVEIQEPQSGQVERFDPAHQSIRAVTIDAPVDVVWPWLAQIGQDRGGFYSYEWLENLAGCTMRNADRIHPEWQHRDVGETVLLHPLSGLPVTTFQPGRAIGLKNWATFVVEPLDESRTRLIARGGPQRGWGAFIYALTLEIPHFIMERKMLLGIKERAERSWRTSGAETRRVDPIELPRRFATAQGSSLSAERSVS